VIELGRAHSLPGRRQDLSEQAIAVIDGRRRRGDVLGPLLGSGFEGRIPASISGTGIGWEKEPVLSDSTRFLTGPSSTAQRKPTAPLTVSVSLASHWHRRSNGSVNAAKLENVLFANASRTRGHSGSVGCNSGMHDGRRPSTTFGGTAHAFATCHPALSTITTRTVRPRGPPTG
jgi:hypothetical protein